MHMLIEGLHCAACSWLIESALGKLDGVQSIQVDVSSGTGTLRWAPSVRPLSEALAVLVRLGYRPHPLESNSASRAHQHERSDLLKRLAVSGLGMMQVMMFSVATYAGAMQGIDPAIERLLLGVSMIVAAAVVFYAGAPFLSGALRALLTRRLNMDVPVAIALLLAFGASCLHFYKGEGATYFESVSMFVFFLLCARFVAMLVRHKALDAKLALAPMLPDVALKLIHHDGHKEEPITAPVPRTTLRPGDLIRVPAGEAVAADGVVEHGSAHLDESLLSGESEPVAKQPGDTVLAASINLDGALLVRVCAADADSRVAHIATTLSAVRHQRPVYAGLGERLARHFVLALLVVASAVGAVWWLIAPERALGIVLAVLVVTCPCALSLAIPTALSAAASQLARGGLLVNRLEALESLSRITHAVFDKTGTLSQGKPVIDDVVVNPAHSQAVSAEKLLCLVSSLEQHASHPLAEAFRHIPPAGPARNVQTIFGCGLCGSVGTRALRVGHGEFVGVDLRHPWARQANVLVADQDGLLGAVMLSDAWRADARTTIDALRARGIRSEILSGDRPERVNEAVRALGLDSGTASCLPEEKVSHLHMLQDRGEVVLAVGDGVNDAPLLAGADVSVALTSGAQLAQSGADIVLTGSALHPLTLLPDLAQRLQRTIRQNLLWAIGYNVLAVPLAALGLIGPGFAALGMSLSSLFVVLNSSRFAWQGERGFAAARAAGQAAKGSNSTRLPVSPQAAMGKPVRPAG